MEKELEEAVQNVDFERVERVSDGLVSVERDRENLLVVGREDEVECDAVEVKMQGALEMQIVAEEECASLLQSFAVEDLFFVFHDILIVLDEVSELQPIFDARVPVIKFNLKGSCGVYFSEA